MTGGIEKMEQATTVDSFVMCEFCGKLLPVFMEKEDIEHIAECVEDNDRNYDEENDFILRCYSCGQKDKSFSSSQKSKQGAARCRECVASSLVEKAAPYKEVAFGQDVPKHIDDSLMKNVSDINFDEVKKLLEKGVNANYVRQDVVNCRGRRRLLYKEDGSEFPENDETQPTTPLKMCVFRFSDCLLGPDERRKIINIVKLLIEYGAERKDAKALFIMRYGGLEDGDGATEDAADDHDWLHLLRLLSEQSSQKNPQ